MSGRRVSWTCAFAFALALVLALPAARADDRPEIGSRAGRIHFLDVRYVWRSLDDFGERKAFVLVFTARGCPIAERYLPRLASIEPGYRERGVQFVAVDVGRASTIVEMAAVAVDHGLEFPIVKDPDGEVARALGVERTPEVVVLDAGRRLVYRGRIDRQYRIGGANPEPGREDLREAIEDVLSGREVSVAETEVDGCPITFPAPAAPPRRVGWAEDVAPILRRRCEGCHRPGGEGPFSLATWEDARARAGAIAEAVEQRRMPPWFADPRHGEFANDPSLSAEEVRTILDWARGGAASGNVSRRPAPAAWPTGKWRIEEPDLVLRAPAAVEIPAEGYVPYQYAALHHDAVLPYVFLEDTWVARIQILPENPAVLHHANLFYGPIAGGKRREYHFVTGLVPGGTPLSLEDGTAFLIPKGSVLGLQMHYVTTGVATSDRISVGIVFAGGRVEKRLRHLEVFDRDFAIPPGAPAHRVVARRTLERDVTGLGMYVHMHLRGRDMRFVAHAPGGRPETLLLVPNYSFDWQRSYVWEKGARRFAAGTEIECIAHFDNSAFNPYNPDPAAEVRFGQQTYDEMMYGFFFYVEDDEALALEIDPGTGRTRE